jgi:hypothetical protein
MGTRGFTGVAIDGDIKISYNHWDSYPSGLGLKTLHDLRAFLGGEGDDIDAALALPILKQRARDVTVFADDEDVEPSKEDVERFRQFADTSVGGPITNTEIRSYYQLLRNLQGELLKQLELGAMLDAGDFYLDSLFCEWAYLLDLDAGTFQVYRGFQKARHDKGRWAGLPTDEDIAETGADAQRRLDAGELNQQQFEYWSTREYHSIALVAEWPLGALPDNDEFILRTEVVETLESEYLSAESVNVLDEQVRQYGGVPAGKTNVEKLDYLISKGVDHNAVLARMNEEN